MLDKAQRRMTPQEFYAWQEPMDEKYELVDGYPLEMTPATRRHDQIVLNIIAEIGSQLHGSDRHGFTSAITIATRPKTRRRADVGVDCGPYRDEDYAASNPKLVVEVLSSSDELNPSAKINEYKALDCLDHILVIEPDAPRVLFCTRGDDHLWDASLAEGLDATVDIPDLGITLKLEQVYADLDVPFSTRFQTLQRGKRSLRICPAQSVIRRWARCSNPYLGRTNKVCAEHSDLFG
jgi:Uma2 family endonuclease